MQPEETTLRDLQDRIDTAHAKIALLADLMCAANPNAFNLSADAVTGLGLLLTQIQVELVGSNC